MWHHALLHSYPTTINIILFMGLVDLSLGTITLVQKCMFNFCVIKHCLYKDNSRVYFTPFCTSSAGGYCRFNYTYYYWHHLFLGRSAECLHAIQSCFSKNLQCSKLSCKICRVLLFYSLLVPENTNDGHIH